jgi:hypothetical protein
MTHSLTLDILFGTINEIYQLLKESTQQKEHIILFLRK